MSSSVPSKDVHKPSTERKLIYLARSCVKFQIGDDCVPGNDEKTGKPKLICSAYCSKDGCNGGDKILIPPLLCQILLIFSFHIFTR